MTSSAEFIIVGLVILVVFGGAWLPKAARNLGRAKVEIDKAQKQFEDTKQQVVESTGLDKADATLRKANRVLNQSPKQMMKGAVTSAALGGSQPETAANDAAEEPSVVEAQIADGPAINVEWSADEAG